VGGALKRYETAGSTATSTQRLHAGIAPRICGRKNVDDSDVVSYDEEFEDDDKLFDDLERLNKSVEEILNQIANLANKLEEHINKPDAHNPGTINK